MPSSISGSTTRTLVVPDANGTIATQAYVQTQITAEDLDTASTTTDSPYKPLDTTAAEVPTEEEFFAQRFP